MGAFLLSKRWTSCLVQGAGRSVVLRRGPRTQGNVLYRASSRAKPPFSLHPWVQKQLTNSDTIPAPCQHNNMTQMHAVHFWTLRKLQTAAGEEEETAPPLQRNVYSVVGGGAAVGPLLTAYAPLREFQPGLFSWKLGGICHRVHVGEAEFLYRTARENGRGDPAVFELTLRLLYSNRDFAVILWPVPPLPFVFHIVWAFDSKGSTKICM